MAEPATNNQASPPAASGGLPIDQVQQLLEPLTRQLQSLADNQQVLASTLAQLPPAKPEAKPDGKGGSPAGLTVEDVQRLLEQRDVLAARRAAQQATRAKVVAEVLGGDAELGAYLPETDDAAQLTAAAQTLAAKLKPAPDVGGAGREGGKPQSQQAVDYSKLSPSRKVEIGLDQLLNAK